LIVLLTQISRGQHRILMWSAYPSGIGCLATVSSASQQVLEDHSVSLCL